MATISNDYPTQRRTVDELEQDYELTKKRLKDASETREARMESNYKRGLQEAEERTDKTANTLRDEFVKSNSAARENDRAARSELTKTHYDRLGRIQEQADTNRKAAAHHIEQLEKTSRTDAERMKDLQNHYEARLNRNNEDRMKTLEESARKLNDSNGRVMRAAGTYTEAEYQTVRSDAEKAMAQAREDSRKARAETANAVEAAEDRTRTMQSKYENDGDDRTARTQQTYEEKLKNNAESERRSRETETEQLRKQIKDFAAQDKLFGKDLNEARARTIRETEGEYSDLAVNQEIAFRDELNHQKSLERSLERNLNRNFDDALREKEGKQALAIKRITAETQDNLSQTRNEFDRAISETKVSHEHEKDSMNRTFSAQRQTQLENTTRALDKQAEAYRNAMSQSNQSSTYRNDELEKQNRDLLTTQDPSKVSAGVENKIREKVAIDYDKRLNAERDRNSAQAAHTRGEYQERFDQVIMDKNRSVAGAHRQALTTQTELNRQFTNVIDELEYSKQQALKNANDTNTKIVDTTRKNSERALVAQAHQSSETGAERDLNNELRLKALQEDHDFADRQTRREYAVRMNIAQKDFERKLTVQREDYENQIDDLKKTLSTFQRDSDKRTAQLLSEQERASGKKIAELESQMKQREKVQQRSYEEELDKVKRANALLLSKKS